MLLHESGNHVATPQAIVKTVMTQGNVVIMTYQTLRIRQKMLLKQKWGYVILDEGHKIRNPGNSYPPQPVSLTCVADADISLVCKQLKTVHRIILTGAPIQNTLKELWCALLWRAQSSNATT